MTRRILIAGFTTLLFLLPSYVEAYAMEDVISRTERRPDSGRITSLKGVLQSKEAELSQKKFRLRQQLKEYNALLKGLNYEKETLKRERESLIETVERNRIIERDILNNMNFVGTPNHLKQRDLQTRLRNAEEILEADRANPFADLERREEFLTNETALQEKRFLQEREALRNEESQIKREVAVLKRDISYARNAESKLRVGFLTRRVKTDLLSSRKMRKSIEDELRAARVAEARARAVSNNYLTRVQPEVQDSIAREFAEESLFNFLLLQRAILESLSSDRAPEELQREQLRRFMSGQ